MDEYNGQVAAAETLAHFAHAVSAEFRRRMRHSIDLIRVEQQEQQELQQEQHGEQHGRQGGQAGQHGQQDQQVEQHGQQDQGSESDKENRPEGRQQ